MVTIMETMVMMMHVFATLRDEVLRPITYKFGDFAHEKLQIRLSNFKIFIHIDDKVRCGKFKNEGIFISHVRCTN